jgi:hypothetical protein
MNTRTNSPAPFHRLHGRISMATSTVPLIAPLIASLIAPLIAGCGGSDPTISYASDLELSAATDLRTDKIATGPDCTTLQFRFQVVYTGRDHLPGTLAVTGASLTDKATQRSYATSGLEARHVLLAMGPHDGRQPIEAISGSATACVANPSSASKLQLQLGLADGDANALLDTAMTVFDCPPETTVCFGK